MRREVGVTGEGSASDWWRAVRHGSLVLKKNHSILAERSRLSLARTLSVAAASRWYRPNRVIGWRELRISSGITPTC